MNLNEVQMQNLLAEHIEALIAGKADAEALLANYALPLESRAGQLLLLAERLFVGMPEIKPSSEFVARLHDELVGASPLTILARLRQIQSEIQGLGLGLGALQGLQLPNLASLQEIIPNLQLKSNLQLDRSIDRFRHMPRYYQLAAGLTLTAGVVLFASRRTRESLSALLAAAQQQYQAGEEHVVDVPSVEISA